MPEKKSEAPEAAPVRRPVEEWQRAKKPAAWAHASAAVLHRWVVGEELTEAEYDAALAAASTVKLGY